MKLNTFKKTSKYAQEKGIKLFEAFQKEESHIKEITEEQVRKVMERNLDIMYETIQNGLKNNAKSLTGLSGDDSQKILNNNNSTPFGDDFKKIIAYALAVMEENLSMGKIVACPTAGSCGIVPAAIAVYAEKYNTPKSRQIDALITAGGVGKIVSNKVALSGAVAGCQAECGVAAAMAAAAVTEMAGGNTEQILDAVALALKNILGLVCDPIAGMVEIPCMKRNSFLAVHAFVASQMALSGVKSAIPADEVVDALKQIGLLMSPLLKECSQAGLATTPSGLEIKAQL